MLVAHALGRRPVHVRITPQTLPVGHPANPYDEPTGSAGFHLAEPRMADEINSTYQAGHPLTDAQVEWLLQEIVMDLGGPVAEAWFVGGEPSQLPGATTDLHDVGQKAGILGHVEMNDDETEVVDKSFLRAAGEAAMTILADLIDDLNALAATLLARRVMHERDLDAALAGSPRGSHRHVLDPLRRGNDGATRPTETGRDEAPPANPD